MGVRLLCIGKVGLLYLDEGARVVGCGYLAGETDGGWYFNGLVVLNV